MPATPPALDELRAELDAIDEQMIVLLARRLEVVSRIKQAKRQSGKHLFDRDREQRLLARTDRKAAELGISNAAARALMGALLDSSHQVQAEPDASAGAGQKRRVLVVGGRGKMGRLYVRLLSERGHQVSVLEHGDGLEADAVEAADVVIVAVPMTEAVSVTRALAPRMRCDINSLKSEVCGALAESRGEALGTHPMFGPTVGSFRRQKIVHCPVKPGPLGRWLVDELGHMGAELTETDAETHDRMMAVVQVLTHFGIMVMGRALSRSGVALHDTLRFMSPIYRLELSMIGRLFSQNPQLYREILMSNPAGSSLRERFSENARELADIIEQRDEQAFERYFDETARYFADFSAEAMALSDHIIATVMSRP
jgi:chorismate mutase/prephenate dehydrogenase